MKLVSNVKMLFLSMCFWSMGFGHLVFRPIGNFGNWEFGKWESGKWEFGSANWKSGNWLSGIPLTLRAKDFKISGWCFINSFADYTRAYQDLNCYILT